MTREEKQKAIDVLKKSVPVFPLKYPEEYNDHFQTIQQVINWLEQEPKEITLEDVKGYCRPRLLTIITNELYHELTQIKIKTLEQEPVIDKIRAEIEKAVWEDVVVSSDGTDEVRIPRLDPDDVFKILDKYKAKSEE